MDKFGTKTTEAILYRAGLSYNDRIQLYRHGNTAVQWESDKRKFPLSFPAEGPRITS